MSELVDASVLAESLIVPGGPWRRVDVVAETGSTNADLAAAAREGESSGRVLVSLFQATGRGRLGRTWQAPPGTSVAVSVIVRPTTANPRWPWLSLVTGLAVADGIRSATALPAEVKWPNDVLIRGRKVCGILTERVGDAAVIGMGINTVLTEADLPVPTATSLAIEGSDASVTAVLVAVLGALGREVRRWDSAADLDADYAAGCATVGRDVEVHISPHESVVGRAEGVDRDGRLLVRTGSGVRAFAAGDVHHLR